MKSLNLEAKLNTLKEKWAQHFEVLG